MSKFTMENVKKLCDAHGIKLISYEEGAHLLQATFPEIWGDRIKYDTQGVTCRNDEKYIFYNTSSEPMLLVLNMLYSISEVLLKTKRHGELEVAVIIDMLGEVACGENM